MRAECKSWESSMHWACMERPARLPFLISSCPANSAQLRRCAKNAGNSVAHYFGARWQGSDKPTALNVLEPLWHPSLVSQLLQKWSSYTVFTFVRHPLRRAFRCAAIVAPRAL